MRTATPDRAERTRRGVARWCDQADTTQELFEGVARRLEPVLGYDIAAWLVTDPATVLFTDAYIEGFPYESCALWYHHELSVPNVAVFRDLALERHPVSVLSQAMNGDVTASPRWQEVLAPIGYGHELRVVFREGAVAWGAATLHRESTGPDFTSEDAELVMSLSSIIASGLRRVVARRHELPAEPDGPGLLLVGSDGVARAATEAGERWLDLLGVPGGGQRHTALLTLGELVTGGSAKGRRVRLRTRDGHWATLHAEPMSEGDSGFAVIVEPSRPAEIGVVVALAHGLSARETELVLALARGEGTQAIADRLFISTHTVRDHLKAIFDKTGVASRNELIARLFRDHYTDQLFSEAVGKT